MAQPGIKQSDVIEWLLQGDVAIQHQTCRDLLGEDRPDLRKRIATEGWGKAYLDHRNADGGWGIDFYQPQWTSAHYTLLSLKQLGIMPDCGGIGAYVRALIERFTAQDGGIGTSIGLKHSDVCVNGMFLNYASYFGVPDTDLHRIIDFLLDEHMADGGFNCRSNRSGAHHSSLHSTLSVIEGIQEYATSGGRYRIEELQSAASRSRDFILQHRFYRSDRTGTIIDKRFLQFTYPSRWRYNILRALDHFRAADQLFDSRMTDALDVLQSKRRKDGLWPREAAHPGNEFFTMEPPRGPGRWNTLQALRVLQRYRPVSA